MKLSLALALLLVSATLDAQENEVISRGDSLIVRSENITSNLFDFGEDPLAYLKAKPNLSRPLITTTPFPNPHVHNQVDTIFAITFEQDSFQIYKAADNKNFLLYSQIKTDRFRTRNGIQVEMTKSQVKSCLKEYNLSAIPKYLILENTEIIETISLEFNSDLLIKIEFRGYSD